MSDQDTSTSAEIPLFGFDPKILPDIDFCQKDASVIQAQIITDYENLFFLRTKIAKTLADGDPVRLFLLTLIYQFVVQRSIVDSTGKENLLKYAHGENLDNLGAKWGLRGMRLPATTSTTMLRFSLSSPLTTGCLIPLGTLAASNDGRQFRTVREDTIVAGGTAIDLPAESVLPGIAYNGLVAGQINQLVSWNSPFLVSVQNITSTTGGADIESDDRLRARIWMAPESFSVAGPYGAYEYWAASAHPDIIDVSVWSDADHAGEVYIHPLMKGGAMPSTDVINKVYATCNADFVRPLTDHVFVLPPTPVAAPCTVKYWIKSRDGQFEAEIKKQCEEAFQAYLYWQQTKIGRDINPSKCNQLLIEAGAKRTDISEVDSNFEFQVVDSQSVAALTAPTLTYVGIEDE